MVRARWAGRSTELDESRLGPISGWMGNSGLCGTHATIRLQSRSNPVYSAPENLVAMSVFP